MHTFVRNYHTQEIFEPRQEKIFSCIWENKGADQLLHKYYPSTSFIRNVKPLTIFCGCTAWFVSDLVGNPEDRFYHDSAHLSIIAGYMESENSLRHSSF